MPIAPRPFESLNQVVSEAWDEETSRVNLEQLCGAVHRSVAANGDDWFFDVVFGYKLPVADMRKTLCGHSVRPPTFQDCLERGQSKMTTRGSSTDFKMLACLDTTGLHVTHGGSRVCI